LEGGGKGKKDGQAYMFYRKSRKIENLNWNQLAAKYFPLRQGVECKERFEHLNKVRKRASQWTEAEDEKVRGLIKIYGTSLVL
jgi:hypothetical protein